MSTSYLVNVFCSLREEPDFTLTFNSKEGADKAAFSIIDNAVVANTERYFKDPYYDDIGFALRINHSIIQAVTICPRVL